MSKIKNSAVEKVVSIDYKDTDILWKDLFTDLHEAKNIQKKTYFERKYLKVFLVEVESLVSSYGKFIKVKGIEEEIIKFQQARAKFFHRQFQKCHSLFLEYVADSHVPLSSHMKQLYHEEYENIRKILIEVFTHINEKLLELIVEMSEREAEKNFDEEQDPVIRQIKTARYRMNKTE